MVRGFTNMFGMHYNHKPVYVVNTSWIVISLWLWSTRFEKCQLLLRMVCTRADIPLETVVMECSSNYFSGRDHQSLHIIDEYSC